MKIEVLVKWWGASRWVGQKGLDGEMGGKFSNCIYIRRKAANVDVGESSQTRSIAKEQVNSCFH